MNKISLILVGGGGHCRSCIDIIESIKTFSIAGIIDKKDKIGEKVSGYKIIGTDEDIARLSKEYKNFLITVGQVKSARIRKELFRKIKNLGLNLPLVASPYSRISAHARAGEGTILMHHTILNAGAEIGANGIVNTGAIIEHDCKIGSHVHIATGSILCGNVEVGDEVLVGAGSTVLEGRKIGLGSLIGAGSTVVKDIEPFSKAFGTPCRTQEKLK